MVSSRNMDKECVLDSHVNIRLAFTAPCKDLMFNIIYQRCVRYIWLADVTSIAPIMGKYLRIVNESLS